MKRSSLFAMLLAMSALGVCRADLRGWLQPGEMESGMGNGGYTTNVDGTFDGGAGCSGSACGATGSHAAGCPGLWDNYCNERKHHCPGACFRLPKLNCGQACGTCASSCSAPAYCGPACNSGCNSGCNLGCHSDCGGCGKAFRWPTFPKPCFAGWRSFFHGCDNCSSDAGCQTSPYSEGQTYSEDMNNYGQNAAESNGYHGTQETNQPSPAVRVEGDAIDLPAPTDESVGGESEEKSARRRFLPNFSAFLPAAF